jgi:hypothetical protein
MSSTNNAKKTAALIRRHATVFDIKRKALAAESIRPEEVRELFAHPATMHGKSRHQLRALFVVSIWGLGDHLKTHSDTWRHRGGKAFRP